MFYAVKVTSTGADFMVTCRDLPEFASVGDTEEEALREALDGLETTLQMYMNDRRPIPPSSDAKRGERLVYLPALSVAKLGLYDAMIKLDLRKADLVRLLDVHGPQVDRLLSLLHKSKLDQVEDALKAVGYRILISVEPARVKGRHTEKVAA